MAWRSGGATNDELCSNLWANRVIRNPQVLEAFRQVPRAHFVPPASVANAYNDAPLRSGHVHLSAPHIYGAVMDALEFVPGVSFLNVGSGTGYLSAIAAVLGGPTSLNHGVEISPEVHEWSLERLAALRADRTTVGLKLADVEIVCANVYDMDLSQDLPQEVPSSDPHSSSSNGVAHPLSNSSEGNGGRHTAAEERSIFTSSSSSSSSSSLLSQPPPLAELLSEEPPNGANVYDRVYVGAGCTPALRDALLRNLVVGGIFVGPVGDELVKIRRVDDNPNGPTGGNFTVALLSGVQFVPLTRPSPTPTVGNAPPPPYSALSHPPSQQATAATTATTANIQDSNQAAVDSSRASSSRVIAAPLVEKKRPCLPTPRWSPANHACFPDSFKKSALAVLGLGLGQRQKLNNGCSSSGNGGSTHSLPNVLWIEVLSFTTRGWFEPKPSAEAKLATRLAIESKARAQAEAAAASAQMKLKATVKECAEYKALAQRLHGQLREALENQGNGHHPSVRRASSSSSDAGMSGGGGAPPRRFGLVSNLLDRHLSTFFGHPPAAAAAESSQTSAAAVEAAMTSESNDDDGSDDDDDDDDDDGENNDISFGSSSSSNGGNGGHSGSNGNGYHVAFTGGDGDGFGDGDGDGGFEESESESESDASSDDMGHHDGPFEASMELAGV